MPGGLKGHLCEHRPLYDRVIVIFFLCCCKALLAEYAINIRFRIFFRPRRYSFCVADINDLMIIRKSNGPLYEKLSLQYNFPKDLFAMVMLKVHWGRADYIGWGLGYKFDKKYGKRTVR